MELALLRVQPPLRQLRAAAAAPQHARRQAELRNQVSDPLPSSRLGSGAFKSRDSDRCYFLFSGLKVAAEAEAGRGSGREEDRDARPSLYAWIHPSTPTETKPL